MIALYKVLDRQGVNRADYEDILMHIASTHAARLFCVAAAAGVVEDAFRAAYDAVGAPELRCIQKRAYFAIYLIEAVVRASATNREPALRALLEACRIRGETFSIPTGEGVGTHIGIRFDRACTHLCDWIAEGPLSAISLEYLDVLDLSNHCVVGTLSMMQKLSMRPSSPTLIAIMRTFPPDAWAIMSTRVFATPLDMMYASSKELFMSILPHIPDAAFARCGQDRRPTVCSNVSAAVSMSTFSAVWERSREHLTPADAAYLCGVLLAPKKKSMHLQLDLVLSSLSDEARMEVLCIRPDGRRVLHAGILARVTRYTSPAALAVVLRHILGAPQRLLLMAQTTLTNFFCAMNDTDPQRNTEDVLRLLIEACLDERALDARDAFALVNSWYIGDRSDFDNIRFYMRYVSPEFLDYMLERVPFVDALWNDRYRNWLCNAAREELYEAARVIERHIPHREEVRSHMKEHFPEYAAHIYPTLTKSAVCT